MPQPTASRHAASHNIGPRERRVRLVVGGVLLAAGLWIASILVARNVGWEWRLLLFPLFFQGIRFIFDYRTGTCPLKAELGQRNMDGWMTLLGDRVPDTAQAHRIRRVSRQALVWSVLGAILMTAGVVTL